MEMTITRNGVLTRCEDPGPTVTVPDGVREIGRRPFKGNPAEIVLPEGLEVLRTNAFRDCSQLTRVNLPASLREIREGAFRDCRSLTALEIPAGVPSIPESAFLGCRRLTDIRLPEGIREIGAMAFSDCYSLVDPRLPSTVERIGEGAFSRCPNLMKDVALPEGVKILPPRLFEEDNLHSLTAAGIVEIPDTMDETFCHSLDLLILPAASIRIVPKVWKLAAIRGFAAWDRQGGATDPAIRGDYIRYLRSRRRFLADDALQDLCLLDLMIREKALPDDLSEIMLNKATRDGKAEAAAMLLEYRHSTFGEPDPERKNRQALRSLDRDGLSQAEFRANWRAKKKKDGTLLLQKYLGADAHVTIPALRGQDPVTELAEGIFQGHASLLSVTIPDGVREIGNLAFEGCPDLERVDLPNGLTSIGNETFANCPRLSGVTLPQTLKSIGEKAFFHCAGLEHIDFPESLESIDSRAFEGCTALASLTLPDQVTSLGYHCFHTCSALTSARLSDRLKMIPSGAFNDCSALREVHFPEDLQKIDSFAFSGCVSLASVELPEGLTRVDIFAFSGCAALTRLRLPSSLRSMENHAFQNCTALKELELPAGLMLSGTSAFSGCTSLERVEQASRDPKPQGQTWCSSMFHGCGHLRHLRIPAQVSTLNGACFFGCASLERWDVDPDNPWLQVRGPLLLNRNGQRLLALLPTFTGELELPPGIRAICKGACLACPGLTAVTIPASVERIQECAFAECPNLERVTFQGTPKAVHQMAFLNSPVNRTLQVPDGTKTEKVSMVYVPFYLF